MTVQRDRTSNQKPLGYLHQYKTLTLSSNQNSNQSLLNNLKWNPQPRSDTGSYISPVHSFGYLGTCLKCLMLIYRLCSIVTPLQSFRVARHLHKTATSSDSDHNGDHSSHHNNGTMRMLVVRVIAPCICRFLDVYDVSFMIQQSFFTIDPIKSTTTIFLARH